MIRDAFELLLSSAGIYIACGLLVATLFLARWYRAFDPSAVHGSWGFRVVILPGVVVLWPLILAKTWEVWRGRGAAGEAESPVRPETLRRSHGIAFMALAVLGPLLFAVALTWRAPRLEDVPPTDVPAIATLVQESGAGAPSR